MKCYSGRSTAQGRWPCGQCMPCRINKQRKWASRIVMEWAMHPERCYFLTFTYREIPKNGSLEKQRFRQWLKDAQKKPHIGPLRYYAVGEYGEKMGRPHYHLAVFPVHPAQIVALCQRWEKRFGFTHAVEINHARASYLAQYTTKKLTGSARDPNDAREPEFRISSRNPPLGAAFVERLVAHYKKEAGQSVIAERGDIERSYRLDGRIYPIGDWALTKARKELGIPLLHRDRMSHPNYLNYHDIEEAEWDPDKATQIRLSLTAKKRAKLHRGSPRM